MCNRLIASFLSFDTFTMMLGLIFKKPKIAFYLGRSFSFMLQYYYISEFFSQVFVAYSTDQRLFLIDSVIRVINVIRFSERSLHGRGHIESV